jgi:hypothetical protein
VLSDWTGCLKPAEMTLTVTLISDDETEVARYCREHADDWLSMHADDKKLKFKVQYDEGKGLT